MYVDNTKQQLTSEHVFVSVEKRKVRTLYKWLSRITGVEACWIEDIDEQDQPFWGFVKRVANKWLAVHSKKLMIGALAMAPVLLAPTQQAVAQRSVNLSDLSGPSGFAITGVNGGDGFGSALAAGDINGDGLDDMIIGARKADVNGKDFGQVYVVFGKTGGFGSPVEASDLNGVNGFVLNGRASGAYMGISVSSGDINGDGFDDVITGAEGFSFDSHVSVLFGKGSFAGSSSIETSSLDGTTGFNIDDSTSGTYDYFGTSVSSGDVNGDGFDDVFIGARGEAGYMHTGTTYVVFGKSTAFNALVDLSSIAAGEGFSVVRNSSDSNFGATVSSGDVNGDGVDDFITSRTHFGGSDHGYDRVYVMYGHSGSFSTSIDSSSLSGATGFLIKGRSSVGAFGRSISTGDVNGDGIDDLLIQGNDAHVVVFGSSSGSISSIDISSLDGANGFEIRYTASSVSIASGDINGDGIDDVIIGSPSEDANTNLDAGKTYVVFGKTGSFASLLQLSSLNGSTGFALNGGSVNHQSGTAVASGDINGDGRDDLFIGTDFSGPNPESTVGMVDIFTQLVENAVITGDEGWRMLAAPASGTVLDELLSPFWTQGATAGADTNAGAANVYVWDPTLDTNSASNSGDWVAVTDLTTQSLGSGQGFLFYAFSDDNGPGAGNIGFPKVLSTIDMHSATAIDAGTVAVTSGLGDGRFFLAGNPFVSTIDWDDAGVSKTNLSNTIYIWDDASSVFQSWNGSVGNIANGRIEPMQSFFTQALGGSGALSIDAAAKTSSQGTFLKTAPDSEHKALKIHAEAGALKADAWLSFQQGGALARDKYDGLALQSFNAEYLRLATVIESEELLQINALPVNQDTELSFPLELSGVTGQARATVTFEGLEAFEGWDMVIHDHQTGQEYPIEEGVRMELDIQAVNAKQVTRPGLPTPVPVKKKASSTRYSISLQPGLSVSTEEPTTLPTEVALDQNFPNPFNPTTSISFALPQAGDVRLEVFDLLGRKVSTLVNARQAAGQFTVNFDASSLSSGVYIYRLQAGGTVLTRKLNLIK